MISLKGEVYRELKERISLSIQPTTLWKKKVLTKKEVGRIDPQIFIR